MIKLIHNGFLFIAFRKGVAVIGGKIESLWKQLYGENQILGELLEFIGKAEAEYTARFGKRYLDRNWFRNSVVYSLYVDLYNKSIKGLSEKLDHIAGLGADCLWLLPVLQSPMKDAGFDISDYTKIRTSLLSEGKQEEFEAFLNKARERGIRVIFDIALNHCSQEHPWFAQAAANRNSVYRDYFIWSDSPEKYGEARIIFKGICDSNWEYDEKSGQYYFHRFFPMQPDLNYANPRVFFEMAKVLVFWKLMGLDGFRADAIPYLWKEDGTVCENLEKTHTVVKLFRAVLDRIDPSTLLLAEACQQPEKVVEYFGDGDECNGAYHFPVMPRIFMSIAQQSNEAVKRIMSPQSTPENIPENCQWFMFLRCHDELTLEMVSEEERKIIFDHYAKDPSWNFRQGEGISARLASLFSGDREKIMLAYSIMLTLTGTPIIFYGDELGKTNDMEFYEEQLEKTGIKDSRYLARGRIDWEKAKKDLEDENSLAYAVFNFLKKAIKRRKSEAVFGSGNLRFESFHGEKGEELAGILGYRRILGREEILVINNLSEEQLKFKNVHGINGYEDILGKVITRDENGFVKINPLGFYWIKISADG